MKIMIDLRPCMHSYAGIPQDTRQIVKILSQIAGIDLYCHIVSSTLSTWGFTYDKIKKENPLMAQSAYIAHLEDSKKITTQRQKIFFIYMLARQLFSAGRQESLFPISTTFKDFLWSTYFAQSLRIAELDMEKIAFYANATPYPIALRINSILGNFCKINTEKYDIYIGQPPFPWSANKKTKLILRWHDSIPITHVHTINNKVPHQKYFSRTLNLNKKNAIFVCNSDYTRNRLIEIEPELEERSKVAYCCVNDNKEIHKSIPAAEIINFYSSINDSASTRTSIFNKEFPYILAVGTCEPRKNYPLILSAWREYTLTSKRPLQLVIVGNLGWGMAKEMPLIKNFLSKTTGLFWLQNVPSEELGILYARASALVIASFEEGFSYSGVEAMIHKTPVIASDIPVHREIYDKFATYFSPYRCDELVISLESVMNMTESEKNRRTESALSFVQRYSETSCRQQWENILHHIDGE